MHMQGTRALNTGHLKASFAECDICEPEAFDTAENALSVLLRERRAGERIYIAGSLYLAGEVKELLEHDQFRRRIEKISSRRHSPNKLSGGQKQRVSIAGVLAMHPKCIVLDEPTAMLDPKGRREVIRAVRGLNQVEGITVILITHYMEEIIHADRVFVMDGGKVAMEGTPREIFSQVEMLKSLRLDVPQVTLLAYELQRKGIALPNGILTAKELADALCRVTGRKQHS